MEMDWLHMQLAAELKEALQKLAAKDGRNLSGYVRQTLKRHVESEKARETFRG